jgi:protein SERAC1
MRSNLCYFFFKDGFEQQNNAQSALSAILHQIYCFQPTLLKYAMAKYTTTPKRTFKQFSCLYSVLMSTVEDELFRDTICLLDGLDECESKSRDMLVKELAQYFNASPTSNEHRNGLFKIVILSRPDNLIQRRLELSPKRATREGQDAKRPGKQRKFRLVAEDEVAAIAKDVNLFVRAKIEEFGPKSELSEDVLAQVEDKLIHGADFTFLWVSLVIKLLEDAELGGISREQMESILKTSDLDEVYSRLLSGREYPLKARKILYIVLAAARPLTLEEMCVAVEVHQDYHPRKPQEVPIPANAEISVEKLLVADSYSAGPLQSYGKVLRLDYLSGKLRKPFGNHLRLLCGHFLRIRANKIYLVHQTARKFLLDSRPTNDFSVGFWLRSFGWNTERLSAAEIEYLQARKTLSPGDLETWEHSIRIDVATRYLLQVCVDYIQLFETVAELAYKAKMRIPEYIKENDDNPEWAFLTYASVYWVEHYRESRKSLRNCFDFLFEPKKVQFPIWTSRYRRWTPEEESKALRLTGMPINAQNHGNIEERFSREGLPYNKEEEFQRILDYFHLGGIDTEIYDEDHVDGDRYWKESSKQRDEEDETESESPIEERLQDVIPDRIQHFRRKHRNEVQEKIRESWNPMSAGSMNPTSIKSIDALLSSRKDEEEEIAQPTLTFRKERISSPRGKEIDSSHLPRRPRRKKKDPSKYYDLPVTYDDQELFIERDLQELSAETNIYTAPEERDDPSGFWDQGWFQEDRSEK